MLWQKPDPIKAWDTEESPIILNFTCVLVLKKCALHLIYTVLKTVGTVFFFKQKTAYEILSGLVGSEMCIRDSCVHSLEYSVNKMKGTFF